MNKIWRNQTKRVGFQLATGAVGVFSLEQRGGTNSPVKKGAKSYYVSLLNFCLLPPASCLLALGIACLSLPAFAQIVPDATLGSEGSQVTPGVNVGGSLGDRIDGGAVRGSSLFHSFSEFNVNNGQRVYFADPAGIETIFSRVTGSNISHILGTLGVDGAANLFLLNPNGILFGQNARLDIQGSFVASTGDRFVFPGGMEFGASNPQAPPLLTMSVPVGVQYGAQPGTITNRGNLRVGQDLMLAGGNLDLQGQLQAAGDLILQAQDRVQVRDSTTNPFIAAAAGTLLVQGNQGVDIVALSHPNSGLFSGGDMVLRSANTVGGDIHYWSGGNFRIETLDGDLGSLFSPGDPVIRASGDVSFDSYTGASLHIFAGGSVTITGNVRITGADTVGNSIAETVTLSDGTTINIDGSTEPTLDIRAGTTAIGTPNSTSLNGDTFTPNPPNIGVTGTSGDITIGGSIHFLTAPNGVTLDNGGTVFLSNQYDPNSLPSPNGITVDVIDTGGPNQGGAVKIDSRSGITVNSLIITSAFTRQQGSSGDINLLANSNITLNGTLDTSSDDKTNSSNLLGSAGNVTLKAGGGIFLQSDSKIDTSGLTGGSVTLLSNVDTQITNSKIESRSNNNTQEEFGDIQIGSRNGSVFLNNATLGVDNDGSGLAGDVLIDARDRIEILNDSKISGNGNIGRILIGSELTPQTVVIDNSNLTTKGEGEQTAGDIAVEAGDRIEIINGSTISADGNQGGIFVGFNSAPQTVVIDNSNLTTKGEGEQTAGDIFIDARDRIEIINGSTISADGNFGTIVVGINQEELEQLIVINQEDAEELLNAISKNKFTSDQVILVENSKVTTNNSGTGKSETNTTQEPGTIIIQARKITLDNAAEISANSESIDGGGILIFGVELLLMRQSSLISAEAGQEGQGGNGGEILILAKNGFVIAVPSENSDIIANAFQGNGGQIVIETNRIFGLEDITNLNLTTQQVRDRKTSNISASSQFGQQGQVALVTLDIDPSQGLGELPIEVVDPSSLIATGCGVTNGTTANRQSEFVVTGRGGLPATPDDLQTPGTLSPDWVTRDLGNISRADIPDERLATDSSDTLVEAQGMFINAKGELILTAQASQTNPSHSGHSTKFCSPVSDRR